MGRGISVRPHTHSDEADGARPERAGKYGLLAQVDTAGDPATAEIQ